MIIGLSIQFRREKFRYKEQLIKKKWAQQLVYSKIFNFQNSVATSHTDNLSGSLKGIRRVWLYSKAGETQAANFEFLDRLDRARKWLEVSFPLTIYRQ